MGLPESAHGSPELVKHALFVTVEVDGMSRNRQVGCKLSHSARIRGICQMDAGPSSAASLLHARHGAEYEPEAAREPVEGRRSSGHRPTVWRATTGPKVRSS